jgi:SAM-dependent methyltransferase
MDINDYTEKYLQFYNTDICFEKFFIESRRRGNLNALNNYPHKNILEISCGMEPLFSFCKDFTNYTIVEPSETFVDNAKKLANENKKIKIVQAFFEDVYKDLIKRNSFDFIFLSGLLHEVSEPEKLLQCVKKACTKKTVIHLNVPNVFSFHRLLAYEMGLIESIFDQSEKGIMLQRKTCFDKKSLFKILQSNGFEIMEFGTYFIKPFTNAQMEEMINKKIVSSKIIEGLEKMIKYIPDMGAEMFADVKLGK